MKKNQCIKICDKVIIYVKEIKNDYRVTLAIDAPKKTNITLPYKVKYEDN